MRVGSLRIAPGPQADKRNVGAGAEGPTTVFEKGSPKARTATHTGVANGRTKIATSPRRSPRPLGHASISCSLQYFEVSPTQADEARAAALMA